LTTTISTVVVILVDITDSTVVVMRVDTTGSTVVVILVDTTSSTVVVILVDTTGSTVVVILVDTSGLTRYKMLYLHTMYEMAMIHKTNLKFDFCLALLLFCFRCTIKKNMFMI
jgi:hypothetical protein